MNYLKPDVDKFELVMIRTNDGSLQLKVDDHKGGLLHVCWLLEEPVDFYENRIPLEITPYELANRLLQILMKPEALKKLAKQ